MEPVDHDLESILLGYEGNALFMNGQHEKSTEILEIGMRLYPHDYRFQRALATVSEKWAEKVLGLERSKRTIEDVRVLYSFALLGGLHLESYTQTQVQTRHQAR